MEGLFRRRAIWWARLVVPVRLRARAGRREFVQSTGTHEYSVGKMVGSVLLAGWRKQMFEWERNSVNDEKLLRLIEGSPLLGVGGYLPLKEAVALTGLDQRTLLRAVTSDRLHLHVSIESTVPGHVMRFFSLEPVDTLLGHSGGVIVPDEDSLPSDAQALEYCSETVRVYASPEVANYVLAHDEQIAVLRLLEAPAMPGWVFVASNPIEIEVEDFALAVDELERLRLALTARVAPARIEHARTVRGMEELRVRAAIEADARASHVEKHVTVSGKWSSKRFTAAVEGYCSSPDGLPSNLTSMIDQRQRKAGLLLFAEFMGDMLLSEIDGDVLRAFRDGPLKTIPGRVNTLPKLIKRETMTATIEALNADGRDWPRLSSDMQHERMQWLGRLFSWLHQKNYLSTNPAASLRGETGLTKAERIDAKRAVEDDDEGGRAPFTDDELKLIFSQRHFETGSGEHVKKPSVWYGFEYWLPLLGLYCGLRIKEASQLHLSDVRSEAGVWVLDINRKTADKSLKNDQSMRLIPLHPHLAELGFLRYCDRLRDLGYRRVFPELTWSKSDAKYGKEPGRKMSAMLKKLGMPRDSTLVFHCLRHNANNALARVPAGVVPGADEKLKLFIRYRMIGHQVGDDVNVKHYMKTTPSEMAMLMSGVKHNLPTIAPFNIDYAICQIEVALNKKNGDRRGKEDLGPVAT